MESLNIIKSMGFGMVDMQGLTKGVVGFGIAIVSVVIIAIILGQMGTMSFATQLDANNNSATLVDNVIGNGTDVIGSVITTWGDIALLGLVVVTIFAGMLAALFFIARQGGRN